MNPSMILFKKVLFQIFWNMQCYCTAQYCPVSTHIVTSKIFEKLLCKQITIFMDHFLSKEQYGFRRGSSAQDCILVMLENWKRAINKRNFFGIPWSDHPNAFECLSHELAVAKLNADGFSLSVQKTYPNLTFKLVTKSYDQCFLQFLE